MPVELLTVLRKVENRAAHTAHRMQQIVGQIFRYAVATGRVERDITRDLKGALQPVKKINHARLSANELPEFLQKLNSYDGEKQTQNAVRLLMLTFVRTGELRGARKAELNLANAEWRIPAERMKMRAEHVVPLSSQAVELFRSQMEISGESDFLFPNRTRPVSFMSENTILFAIYRMGYHTRTTAHGFRGTASTILHECGFNTEVIERQLAHRDRNAVRSSYNHAVYLPERRKMMQWWADYLDNAARAKPS
jgi:integrase